MLSYCEYHTGRLWEFFVDCLACKGPFQIYVNDSMEWKQWEYVVEDRSKLRDPRRKRQLTWLLLDDYCKWSTNDVERPRWITAHVPTHTKFDELFANVDVRSSVVDLILLLCCEHLKNYLGIVRDA
jgi:hypothetical protein